MKDCFQETLTQAFSLISKRNVKITLRIHHRVDSWGNVFCVCVTMSPRALSQLETIYFIVATEQFDKYITADIFGFIQTLFILAETKING